jgi:hypothetical protein
MVTKGKTMRIPDELWDGMLELAYRKGRGVTVTALTIGLYRQALAEAGLLPVPALDRAAYPEGHRAPAETVKRTR